MDLSSALNLAQTLVLIGTVAVMVWEVRHAHRVSQIDRYRAINDYYTEFLKLSLTYPELAMDDLNELEGDSIDASQRRKLIIAEMLISMWEHAYDSYRARLLPREQWAAWEKWIAYFLQTKLTREQWLYLLEDYGPEFVIYLKKALVKVRPAVVASD